MAGTKNNQIFYTKDIDAQRKARYNGHLVAIFFFFHTRRMMWEIFENDVKNKIEIQWDDIVKMKVDMATYAEFGMLQIRYNILFLESDFILFFIFTKCG